jgi:hypothetical protein
VAVLRTLLARPVVAAAVKLAVDTHPTPPSVVQLLCDSAGVVPAMPATVLPLTTLLASPVVAAAVKLALATQLVPPSAEQFVRDPKTPAIVVPLCTFEALKFESFAEGNPVTVTQPRAPSVEQFARDPDTPAMAMPLWILPAEKFASFADG